MCASRSLRGFCYELWVNYQFDFLIIKGYLNYKYLWCLLYNKLAILISVLIIEHGYD